MDEIINKALNIGNLLQKNKLEKLLKKKNTVSDNSNSPNNAKNVNFLKINKITMKKDEKNRKEPEKNEAIVEKDETHYEKKSNKSDEDELKEYKYASYEVQGYYKRKRKKKIIELDDLEEIKSDANENILLSDEDLINKQHGTNETENEKGTSYLEDDNNIINLDKKKDIFLLYGDHEKFIENNFLEKILENEKKQNKGISKEIDFLIESFKYASIYPDKLINSFYKKRESSTTSNNTAMDIKKGKHENQIPNNIKDMFNEEYNNELKFYQKTERNNSSIHLKDSIDYELNQMHNESFLLKELSLKLGLIKECDMHLNDKELINVFLKNAKFRRALKFYNVSTKNIGISVIYKITKLLYFERPFPRKEKNHKLNLN